MNREKLLEKWDALPILGQAGIALLLCPIVLPVMCAGAILFIIAGLAAGAIEIILDRDRDLF